VFHLDEALESFFLMLGGLVLSGDINQNYA
jgi:hypothetical protein